jgi:hypothetical protein
VTTIAYKAFNDDFTCCSFQYEVGKTYTHDGKISMCDAGFHACENPLDVLNYYNLCDSRFAVVELSGEILKHHEGDSKLCAATLHVRAELSLSDFVKTAVECLIEACKPKDGESSERVIGSSGYGAQLASSGDWAQLASSGDWAQLASSGDGAQLASSGDWAQLASSGNGAQLASSGYGAQLASSGDGAQLASSGDGAQLASSGYGAQLASSGNGAQLASSGNGAQLASSGKNGVICSSGWRTHAKGKTGTWVALAEFDDEGRCIGFATGCAGKDFPADTWVRAKDGKLVEIAK